MNQNYWEQQPSQGFGALEDKTSLNQFMLQIYTWMAVGLSLTGFVALYTASSQTLLETFVLNGTFYILILLELGLVFGFSALVRRGASFPLLLGMFLAYSAINGVTLSVLFLVYTFSSITQVFFITAGMFAGMSAFGYFTKKDLTGMGHFLRMAVFGLIIALVVNLFFQNSMLYTLISFGGVIIFVGLTAYDTQKLKGIYQQESHNEDSLKKLSLLGALTLYLDFINLFIYLLRILGRRR